MLKVKKATYFSLILRTRQFVLFSVLSVITFTFLRFSASRELHGASLDCGVIGAPMVLHGNGDSLM
jgi:hypothetical protein